MEVFRLPTIKELVPYVWTPWKRADEVRGAGPFAGWERMHGVSADPQVGADEAPPVEDPSALPHPYELRCRAVLWDRVHTPLVRDDPNVGRPDPSQ